MSSYICGNNATETEQDLTQMKIIHNIQEYGLKSEALQELIKLYRDYEEHKISASPLGIGLKASYSAVLDLIGIQNHNGKIYVDEMNLWMFLKVYGEGYTGSVVENDSGDGFFAMTS